MFHEAPVLSGYHGPGAGGYGWTGTASDHAQAKAIPILVLTDTLSLEDEVAILSSGATVCAQKPIDLRRSVA